jgi:hypothetical protein
VRSACLPSTVVSFLRCWAPIWRVSLPVLPLLPLPVLACRCSSCCCCTSPRRRAPLFFHHTSTTQVSDPGTTWDHHWDPPGYRRACGIPSNPWRCRSLGQWLGDRASFQHPACRAQADTALHPLSDELTPLGSIGGKQTQPSNSPDLGKESWSRPDLAVCGHSGAQYRCLEDTSSDNDLGRPRHVTSPPDAARRRRMTVVVAGREELFVTVSKGASVLAREAQQVQKCEPRVSINSITAQIQSC